ncbi:MAG: hypothetical protein ACOX6T_23080 [Myxococcales bacterium]
MEAGLIFQLKQDGTLAWVKQLDGAPGLLAIGASRVFASIGELQAFEVNSGDESWNVHPRVGLTHGVLLADNAGGVLYLNERNQLTRFDSNGAETWQRLSRIGPPGSTAMSFEPNGNLLVAWGYSSRAAPDPAERFFEPTTLVLRLDANGTYLASAEPDGRFDRHFVLPAADGRVWFVAEGMCPEDQWRSESRVYRRDLHIQRLDLKQ